MLAAVQFHVAGFQGGGLSTAAPQVPWALPAPLLFHCCMGRLCLPHARLMEQLRRLRSCPGGVVLPCQWTCFAASTSSDLHYPLSPPAFSLPLFINLTFLSLGTSCGTCGGSTCDTALPPNSWAKCCFSDAAFPSTSCTVANAPCRVTGGTAPPTTTTTPGAPDTGGCGLNKAGILNYDKTSCCPAG